MALDLGKDAEAARRIYSYVVDAVAKLGGVARKDEIAKYLTDNSPEVFTEKDGRRAQSIVQIALYKAVGRKELQYNNDGKYQLRPSTPRPPAAFRENRCTDCADSPKRVAFRSAVAKNPPLGCHTREKPKTGNDAEIRYKCEGKEGGKGGEGGDKPKSNNPQGEKGSTKQKKQDVDGKGEGKIGNGRDAGKPEKERTAEEHPKRERVVQQDSEEERKRKARALEKIRAGRTQKPPVVPGVGKSVLLKTRSKMARLASNGSLKSRKPSKYFDDRLSDSSDVSD